VLGFGEQCEKTLIRNLERWTVFRPRLAVIVDPCRGNIRMPEPLLHLGDIGLVIERIGGRRRAQRVCADLKTQLRRVFPHHPIHPVRRDGVAGRMVATVVQRTEEGTRLGATVAGRLEVVGNQNTRGRVQWQVAGLAAFA